MEFPSEDCLAVTRKPRMLLPVSEQENTSTRDKTLCSCMLAYRPHEIRRALPKACQIWGFHFLVNKNDNSSKQTRPDLPTQDQPISTPLQQNPNCLPDSFTRVTFWSKYSHTCSQAPTDTIIECMFAFQEMAAKSGLGGVKGGFIMVSCFSVPHRHKRKFMRFNSEKLNNVISFCLTLLVYRAVCSNLWPHRNRRHLSTTM